MNREIKTLEEFLHSLKPEYFFDPPCYPYFDFTDQRGHLYATFTIDTGQMFYFFEAIKKSCRKLGIKNVESIDIINYYKKYDVLKKNFFDSRQSM